MTAVRQLLEHQDARRIDTTEIQEATIVSARGQSYYVTTADCSTPFLVDGDPNLSHEPGEVVSISRPRGGSGSRGGRFQIVTHARRPTGIGGVLAAHSTSGTVSGDEEPLVMWADPAILFPDDTRLEVVLGGVHYDNLPGSTTMATFKAVRETYEGSGVYAEHPEVTIEDVLGTIDPRASSAVTCTVITTAAMVEGEEFNVEALRVPA